MDALTFTGGFLGILCIVAFLVTLLSEGGVLDELRQQKEEEQRRDRERRRHQKEIDRLDEETKML